MDQSVNQNWYRTSINYQKQDRKELEIFKKQFMNNICELCNTVHLQHLVIKLLMILDRKSVV